MVIDGKLPACTPVHVKPAINARLYRGISHPKFPFSVLMASLFLGKVPRWRKSAGRVGPTVLDCAVGSAGFGQPAKERRAFPTGNYKMPLFPWAELR